MPESFVNNYNSKGGPFLFFRDENTSLPGINSFLASIDHYINIGAFGDSSRRVKVRTTCPTVTSVPNININYRLFYFVVLVDNEAAGKSSQAQTKLNGFGVALGSLPPYLGHLFNLCDNPVHGIIESSIDKDMEKYECYEKIPMEEKYDIYKSAYDSIDPNTIVKAFEATGLSRISSLEDSETKIQEILSEGIYKAKKFMEKHVLQLEAYLNDCIECGEHIPKSDYADALRGPLWEVYSEFLKIESEVDELNK